MTIAELAASGSDHDLMLRARDGDREALARLVARHHGEPATPEDLDRATALVERLLVEDGALPFRAAWALRDRDTEAPDVRATDPVWTAFHSLPPAWKAALWHHEVEGHSRARIAHHLGMGVDEATRAVLSARSSLKRLLALSSTSGCGTGPACERLVSAFRFTPPATLDRAGARELREHGRHCDDCLPLIRRLLIADQMLREHLSRAVLGDLAAAYVADKPLPRRLPRRVPGPRAVERVPVRRLGVVGLAAAAVVGAMTVTPPFLDAPSSPMAVSEQGRVSPGQVPQDAVAPDVVSGAALAPMASTTPGGRLRDVFTTDESVTDEAEGGATTPPDGTSAPAVAPESPTQSPTGPTAPGGDTGGSTGGDPDGDPDGPGQEGPGEPEPPAQAPPVQVKKNDDSVTVVVSPGVEPLPDVEVTLPTVVGTGLASTTLASTTVGGLG